MSPLSLSDLQVLVCGWVEENADEQGYWVKAEILQLAVKAGGHCYLELGEKEADSQQLKAKVQATIWKSRYELLQVYFESITSTPLSAGMQVLLLVQPRFHALYGYSLNVLDIDPDFTLGGLARSRQQVIARLKQEGVWDLNRELPLPLLPQRIAVISSATAAGYGDFFRQLVHNPQGYAFHITLFDAVMQGVGAEESLPAALEAVAERAEDFDVVVLVRGGGAVSDLHCYDSYRLAAYVAQFPLPVIAGVGHDRDVSVLDQVAAVAVKTPTAAAAWLIERAQALHIRLQQASMLVCDSVQTWVREQTSSLQQREQALAYVLNQYLQTHRHRLELLEQALELRSPEKLLAQGYSITLKGGRVVQAADVQPGDVIETQVADGIIRSVVQ